MRPLQETMSVSDASSSVLPADFCCSVRWEATFAGISSLSELRAAVKGEESNDYCDDGLRSICWKVN